MKTEKRQADKQGENGECYMLEIKEISKIINNNTILEDIDLELIPGKIYGIVGRNGSGKTMLFRIIAGLVKPTSGMILYKGENVFEKSKNMPNIGITIENMGMYPEFSGFANLRYLANIRKIASDEDIRNAIARVGLDSEDKRPIKKYSLGMRQRIILAQAFMESPEILLLDEPTNGLDESGVELVRNILKEEAKRGAIVFLSSHNKEDISYLCDEIYHIKSGRIEG